MLVDLHLHTTASDGTLTPGELMEQARKQALFCISITDHDTTDAYDGLCGAFSCPRLIPGIEFGCMLEGPSEKKEVHILGYGIDPHSPALRSAVVRLQEERVVRIGRMVELLQALGADICVQDVEMQAAGESLGRPHVARALKEKGFVSHIDEAFDRYLRFGGPAYVPRISFSAREIMEIIKKAGGVSAAAHPGLSGLDAPHLDALREMGLEGVEVYYPAHSLPQREFYGRFAVRCGLFLTGGSDFHSPSERGASMGMADYPRACFEEFCRRIGFTP